MKKILFLALLLSVAAHAGGTPGNPTGAVTSVDVANVPNVVTLNAVCASPATGCAVGQAITAKVSGRNSTIVQLNSSAFNATVTPYMSVDNGTNWTAILLRNNAQGTASAPSGSLTLNETAVRLVGLVIANGAATDVMLAVTSYTSGTSVSTMINSNSNPSIPDQLTTIKGTQVTGGLQTQDIKDAGRTFIVLGADGVTPAIADTVITFAQNKAGTVTGGLTTYAITSAKTLRIQSICGSFTAGATANIAHVRVRLNTGGACVVGSGLLLPAMELAPEYGTATASEGGSFGCITIPDGLELTGSSWNICLSESAVAASGTLTVNLIGYEY